MAFIPFAPPIRRTNMNTPQKIPKAVRRDRDLLRISVWKISLHLSISNMILSYFALRATIGLMRTAFLAGKKPATSPAMSSTVRAPTAILRSIVGFRKK